MVLAKGEIEALHCVAVEGKGSRSEHDLAGANDLRRHRRGSGATQGARTLAGGPGRTRTCNQTVMSGRISIGFVDFTAFLFDFDTVRCTSMASFLVRNWCGTRPTIRSYLLRRS